MPATSLHDLSGRHIFLTGGTGSVGRTLLDYLNRCRTSGGEFHVTVLTRDASRFSANYPAQAKHTWLSLAEGSLETLVTLPPGVTDVIHAAADTHIGTSHVPWVDQIVGGTRSLLTASAEANIDRFLLISSGAIYGPQPASVPRLREDYLGAPDPLLLGSTYGQAKRLAEHLCAIFHVEQGVPAVIARLFAFGSTHIPGDGRYALGSFVRDALSNDHAPIRVSGDGAAVRSYLDGHDMSHALITALRSGERGQAYNIGSDEPVTIAALAREVRDRLSPDREIVVLGAAGDGQRSFYVPDTTKITALGAAGHSKLGAVIDDVAGRIAHRA